MHGNSFGQMPFLLEARSSDSYGHQWELNPGLLGASLLP